MTKYRITCVRREFGDEPDRVNHVTALGTGRSLGHFDTLWDVDEVLRAIDRGTVFYLKEDGSGRLRRVERGRCACCGRETVRCGSNLGAMDGLPLCEEALEPVLCA
jgi:hypothetical protein